MTCQLLFTIFGWTTIIFICSGACITMKKNSPNPTLLHSVIKLHSFVMLSFVRLT